MTKSAVLVVPGSLDSRTGGYIYDRHIVNGLRSMNWAVDVQALDESFPRPIASAVAHAEGVFATLPAGTVTVVDSLALGAIPDIIERHSSRLRIVALVHLPLAADVGSMRKSRALRDCRTSCARFCCRCDRHGAGNAAASCRLRNCRRHE